MEAMDTSQTQTVIDIDDATEYLRLHAEQSVIEKRIKELRKIILPQLVDGAMSPRELPYLLINRPKNQKDSDWKGYCLKLATKLLRSKKKAAALIDKVDSRWPKDEVPALHVIVNPAYAAKLGETVVQNDECRFHWPTA
jgi:hypothetical protein